MEITTIVVILLMVLIGWVMISPDKLADTLRTRFKGSKQRVATALDSAVDRVQAAEADANAQLAKTQRALVEVKGMRHQVQTRCDVLKASALKYQMAAENAASIGRQDLALEALNRRNTANVELEKVQGQLSFLVGKEQEVQNAVTALTARKAQLRQQVVEIKTRAKTATVTLSVNELLAGVDLSGRSSDVDRAFEILAEIEGKSGAMAEIAESTMSSQRIDQELEALTRPQVKVEDELAQLMGKFNQTSSG